MSSDGKGNGVDLGVINTMLMQLVEATRRDVAEIKRDLSSLERRVTILEGKFVSLSGEVASLRSELRDYHGAVMGQGILYMQLGRGSVASRHTST